MTPAVEWAATLVDARPSMLDGQARDEVIASLASIIETIQGEAAACEREACAVTVNETEVETSTFAGEVVDNGRATLIAARNAIRARGTR